MTAFRLALTSALLVGAATAAFAGERAGYDRGTGTVVAESRWGHGTVSGPVRYTRVGRQVRLPNGTWEHCRRSCSETLRVSSVDFWEVQQGIDGECGVLGCLEITFPRHR